MVNNITLNLYSNNDIPDDVIKKNIFNRNPIICFLNDHTGESVYKVLNLSRVYSKNILTLHRWDLARTFAYLYSFSDLSSKQILFMAPIELKNDAIRYANSIKQLLEQNNVA